VAVKYSPSTVRSAATAALDVAPITVKTSRLTTALERTDLRSSRIGDPHENVRGAPG